ALAAESSVGDCFGTFAESLAWCGSRRRREWHVNRHLLEQGGVIRRVEAIDVVLTKELHEITDDAFRGWLSARRRLHRRERLQQRECVRREVRHRREVTQRFENFVVRQLGGELPELRPRGMIKRQRLGHSAQNRSA